MSYFVVRHTVEDYAKWKPVFDSDAVNRKAAGCQGGQLLRNAENPNDVMVVWKWDNLDNARRFATSPGLREKMHDAGVVGRPDLYFLEHIEDLAV
jgi:heme-degrading monooxygenase HmoA